jgi:hypothetical protein
MIGRVRIDWQMCVQFILTAETQKAQRTQEESASVSSASQRLKSLSNDFDVVVFVVPLQLLLDDHLAVHDEPVPGKRAEVGIATRLLWSLEIDD